MVKSNVCPRCLGELDGCYAEEGGVIVSSETLNCPRCGFTLLGTVDEGMEVIGHGAYIPSD